MPSQHHTVTASPRFISVLIALSVILTPFCILGCGSGSGASESIPTTVEGTLLDTAGKPVVDATLFIFETHESTVTDETGAFSITSYKHLSAGKFFLQSVDGRYSNTVDIGAIPDETVSAEISFALDSRSNVLSVTRVNFVTNQAPSDTPTPGPTAVPGKTPTPSRTPGATRTPTPKPGNFDAAGNTSAFGIPSGVKGNIASGGKLWVATCQSCHAAEKTNRSYGTIKASLRVVPTMQNLHLTTKQIADLTAYLNRSKR